MIDAELRERLYPYMGGIIRELKGSALAINGMEDHVHLFLLLPPTICMSDAMRVLKTNSSGWVHGTFPRLRKFAWQTGYGAFSVSQSNVEVVKRYKMGPLFTPPVVSSLDGPLGTLQLPAEVGGANCPGGSMDPENNHLYIHSHTTVFVNALVPGNPAQTDMAYVAGQARAGGPGARGAGAGAAGGGGAPAGGRGRGGANVQGLPLVKPPYDRITAYDMNTGDIVWQKTHSSTPDDIRNHPALKGLNLPRLGQPGRTFLGVLTTKNLVVAGEGGVHTNEAGRRVALLRAYDKRTGDDVGAVEMPARQTGSPMSYQINGKQYIVLAVSGNDGAELLAYALP